MKSSALAVDSLWLPGFGPEEELTAEVICLPPQINEVPRELTRETEPVAVVAPLPEKRLWLPLSPDLHNHLSGAVAKFEANITAITLLRSLEQDQREPDRADYEKLQRYTGWGGLPQAFNLDQTDKNWRDRSAYLEELLEHHEYRAALASTPNAHFTSVEIIQSIWAMVQRLGFSGGRILEPSGGVGYFIGAMPQELAQTSSITLVEQDLISARIAKSLYSPFGVNVLNRGFEEMDLPENYFDLVISNIPFGDYQVPEQRNVPYANFSIHNYFFAKALEVVRPGGLVAFITSSYTLDSIGSEVRQYLARQADLIAAYRLPNSAFKKIANTEVMTDIVLLQKPMTRATTEPRWVELGDWSHDIKDNCPAQAFYRNRTTRCNQWFCQNPDSIIGELVWNSSNRGAVLGCEFDGDLGLALQERAQTLPPGLYVANVQDEGVGQVISLGDDNQSRRPGFRCIDGNLYEVIDGAAVLYQAPAKKLEQLRGLVAIRDAARELISSQTSIEDEEALQDLRMVLNQTYDRYVKEFGYLHHKTGRQLFKSDPDLPLLLSLENWDAEKKVATKAALFRQRTVGVFKRVETCATPLEALQTCLSERGRISVSRLGQLLNRSGTEVLELLETEGAVYLDPHSNTWVTADEYLSGNVREKLKIAQLGDARFERNVAVLACVIPADLTPLEIGARVGSTWIPTSDYAAFLNETLATIDTRVDFNTVAGAWNLETNYLAQHGIDSTQTYGTARANATVLFEQALNQIVPTVYDADPVDRDKRVINQAETIAAREKQQLLKEAFVTWLWADEIRADRLVRLYNDTMNNTVPRQYDGRHLVLPGFSQVYDLHPHQRDAVWRVVSSQRNTLLAHAVGAGKTLEMICAGMELRRLGKASKPMYVVPNHMLEQFGAEFLRAYPGANILMASKDDLQGDKRRQLISRIATGDWDGILITHASFERIKMSAKFLKHYIKAEVEQIESEIRLNKSTSRGNRIVKELERAKKRWVSKLIKLDNQDKNDDLLNFEDLGIDYLFVDEAHYFKNLWRFTKMNRVAGLPNSNSERAFDMFAKTVYIQQQRDGQSGIVFATGTPVSNSMAELWVMQRYLQVITLVKKHIANFDGWAGNFGESVTALELAPDGSGYRMQTRFARFINMPELMAIFREVADIKTAAMLNLKVPKAYKEIITLNPGHQLKEFVGSLVARAEKIRQGRVSPSDDNMLAVTNDGRKAALDLRLVGYSREEDAATKAETCAHKVHEIWERTAATKATQIIFCDLSTPNKDRFNVYDEIQSHLVRLGIPNEQIAFIHDYDSDAAKEELFKSVREGRVRVLLGSTSKMGVGTNVQTRLIALHHIDAPWRPADIEQREGRILRQGNSNEEVWIYRYVTEGSFDAYIWQTLETKARFIAQVMQGDTAIRTAEDVELAALSYAEVKALASGNPLVLEKAGVDTELAKLALLKTQWSQQQWRNRQEINHLPARIAAVSATIRAIEADIKTCQQATGSKAIEVMGHRYTDRSEAGKALLLEIHAKSNNSQRQIGQYAGFKIMIKPLFGFNRLEVVLSGQAEYETGKADTALGCVMVLENTLRRLPLRLQEEEEHQVRLEKSLHELSQLVKQPFEKQARLEQLQIRQRELDNLLDLTKGENTAVEESEEKEVETA